MTGRPQYQRITTFFWDQVVNHRTHCTAGTSEGEHWFSEPHVLGWHVTGNMTRGKNSLANVNQETCCTYDQLKLARHLFAWDPRNEYAEYDDRALINHILASRDPKTGMMI
ncbi:MAG: beta-L-arabinofuranosidase domain-containing protein [Planctomycetota bacterium]